MGGTVHPGNNGLFQSHWIYCRHFIQCILTKSQLPQCMINSCCVSLAAPFEIYLKMNNGFGINTATSDSHSPKRALSTISKLIAIGFVFHSAAPRSVPTWFRCWNLFKSNTQWKNCVWNRFRVSGIFDWYNAAFGKHELVWKSIFLENDLFNRTHLNWFVSWWDKLYTFDADLISNWRRINYGFTTNIKILKYMHSFVLNDFAAKSTFQCILRWNSKTDIKFETPIYCE